MKSGEFFSNLASEAAEGTLGDAEVGGNVFQGHLPGKVGMIFQKVFVLIGGFAQLEEVLILNHAVQGFSSEKIQRVLPVGDFRLQLFVLGFGDRPNP